MTPIYLQTYSFIDGGDFNSRENLKAAAEMGYAGVELFGPDLAIPVDELKAILTENGLRAISLHASSDTVPELIPFASALGTEFIGIGMQLIRNEADAHAFAARLDELGRLAKESGLRLTYHNHTQEFVDCGGVRIIDILLNETDHKLVSWEMDAGWAAAAGFDPVRLISEHPGRVKLVHVKESDLAIGPQPPMDFSALPKDELGHPIFSEEQKEAMRRNRELNCPAGKGLVNWSRLKEAADADGCKGYIVEREFTPPGYKTRLDVLKADIKYYRSVFD